MSAFRALAPPVQIGRDGTKRFLSRGARSNTNRRRNAKIDRAMQESRRTQTDIAERINAVRSAQKREREKTRPTAAGRTSPLAIGAFIGTVVLVLIIAVLIVLLF